MPQPKSPYSLRTKPPVTRSRSRSGDLKESAKSPIKVSPLSNEPLLAGEALAKTSVNKDFQRVILLVILYLLQGVPLGLCLGSVPFLLKEKLDYSQLALFSLTAYPYSVKLLWSPIVDTWYIRSFGRRKSWIIPIQFLLSLLLIYIGRGIDETLQQAALPINQLAFLFTTLVFLCATQDIAVDGWALELLTDENKTYASTAQSVGLNTGYFLSFTIFLAFNSPEFCNTYIYSMPQEIGVLSLGNYLQFWGFMFLICNLWLYNFTKEVPSKENPEDISQVYNTIFRIVSLPQMRNFIFILMICKIGFMASDSVGALKLLESGFKKEHLALTALIDFPFQLIFGYFAAKWSNGDQPLMPWIYGLYGRIIGAIVFMAVVAAYPEEGVTTLYFLLVISVCVMNSFMRYHAISLI